MSSGVSSGLDSSDNSEVSLNGARNGPSGGLSGIPGWTKDVYSQQYMGLPFLSNYVSVMRNELMDIPAERRKAENERTLMAYYSSKVHTSRHGSVVSGFSNPSISSDSSRKSARMKHAMKSSDRVFSEHRTPLRGASDESKYTPEVFSKGYVNYCSKLPIPTLENTEQIRSHNMWIPIMKRGIAAKNPKHEGLSLLQNPSETTSKLSRFNTDFSISREEDAIDKNIFVGSTNIPPLFGEIKLPPFAYQCTVDLGDSIYTLGGLTPSYYYSDEIPDLNSYYVDGVPNLPPPLLESIVNNPSMVNNHDLYVLSSSSFRVQKPTMTGQIPPPLLCMTGSALTKRHIFFYGGFEIKTETMIDESTGNFYLKKSACLSNRAYILDVITFKFTKVELVAQPTKFNTCPNIESRFGHSQVSLKANNSLKCAVCSAASNSEIKSDIHKRETELLSSPLSQPLDMRSQSESSFFTERNVQNKFSSSVNSRVHTILVIGGYRQVRCDDYETLNDLWKIEVTVLARGKRNYFKFADTALATPFSKLPVDTEGETWPARRAFHACEIYDTELLRRQSSETKLLENLKANFHIEPEHMPPVNPKEKPQSVKNRSEACEQYQHLHHVLNDQHSVPTWQNQKYNSGGRGVGQTLVVHGGSDKTFVYGDLWWFDLETEVWTRVETYQSGQRRRKENQGIDLTLVGHKMVQASSNAIFLGGFTQKDVEEHWQIKNTGHFKRFGTLTSFPASLHLLDLNSLEFEILCVGEEHQQEREDGVTLKLSDALRLISTCPVQKNGFLHLVGGFLCNSRDVREIQLRGTFTTCILPVITTPKISLT
ncbi:LANO_0C00672g1_1 [Lachancea nothofagi CBS 11611]|uniref:LANO_0C00672g1_1 n=1 Tax=Lachancea nothofagi CBS 11611 TaxID=1266666 RepID=A0A1G4J3Y8_9SACH|nr:LANO_0C00672g1_1 [Lachancea nothofagi CBS 11611]